MQEQRPSPTAKSQPTTTHLVVWRNAIDTKATRAAVSVLHAIATAAESTVAEALCDDKGWKLEAGSGGTVGSWKLEVEELDAIGHHVLFTATLGAGRQVVGLTSWF